MKGTQLSLFGLLMILAVVFFLIDAFNRKISVKFESLGWACVVAAGGVTQL